ncbi:MAG: NFYB/HAP3 family transcription factor subunit [Nanoarchaeota archaeon]|nr:NFYB/HAP3 family transcription factor subunit [Nanoarchaeota archaeon]MBU1103250.1 NFYB/HAP3 family transcription factor subunit [Nanoarchaeota archaeon]
MEKNKEKLNTLIKRKNLRKLLKKEGIKRISAETLTSIEKTVAGFLKELARAMKEDALIKGKKTIRLENIKNISTKKKREYPES